MKITVLKNNLKNGLGLIERAIADNNNLPVLKNVLIKTAGNKIQLSATNLEIGITTAVPAKIVEEGALTVPFATFYSIVSNLPNERIDCEVKNNTLLITTDSYDAKIQGLSDSDFPIIPTIQTPIATITIEAAILNEALGQVALAAQVSEVMPEISGALLTRNSNEYKLAATDSFRLAEKTLAAHQVQAKNSEAFRVIIPLKTIQEVQRAFAGTGAVDIAVDAAQILFKNEHTTLISRVIDGKYPDYEQIVPKTSETEVIMEKESFLSALKLVSSFSGKVNEVRLTVDGAKKVLEAHAANQLLGENSYLIPAKIKGPNVEAVSFNWRYLFDGLRALRGNQVLFVLNGNAKPAVLKSPDDASYFYIVMPIRNT